MIQLHYLYSKRNFVSIYSSSIHRQRLPYLDKFSLPQHSQQNSHMADAGTRGKKIGRRLCPVRPQGVQLGLVLD